MQWEQIYHTVVSEGLEGEASYMDSGQELEIPGRSR